MGSIRARIVLALLAVAAACVFAAQASADGPGGPNPSSNFAAGPLPPQCDTDPTGSACVEAAVTYLDAARANLGQSPYVLPSNFDSLTPDEQALVLTDLDRTQYGLPPITGLTKALDQDAAAGVHSDQDPDVSGSDYYGFTSNWAGGYDNMPLAYEAWMYDDGPGSDNVDCPSSGAAGCWGHRENIIWRFDGGGTLAFGAASGVDAGGATGDALLLFEGDQSYHPTYAYTWAEAVAAGAGGPVSLGASSAESGSDSSPQPNAPSKVKIASLRVRGHRISVVVDAPKGAKLRCSLQRQVGHGWRVYRLRACGKSFTVSNLPGGHYRLRITATAGGAATRSFAIR